MVWAGSRLWPSRRADPTRWSHHGHLGVTLLGPCRLRRVGLWRRQLARLRNELRRRERRWLGPRELPARDAGDHSPHRLHLLGDASSRSRPTASTRASSFHCPTTCTPTGRPAALPKGTDSAGRPVRLEGAVRRTSAPSTGSSPERQRTVRSPTTGAVIGVVASSTTSMSWNAPATAARIR